MSRLTFFIAATLAWISANAGTAAVPDDDRTAAVLVVTNCARLAEISTTNDGIEERFDLTAQAISVAPHHYEAVEVWLEKGENVILVKTSPGSAGTWHFGAAVNDFGGLEIEEAK